MNRTFFNEIFMRAKKPRCWFSWFPWKVSLHITDLSKKELLHPLLLCFLKPLCSMACSPSTTLLSNSLHLNKITNQCLLHPHPPLSLNQNLPIYSNNSFKLSTTRQRVITTIPSASGSAGKLSLTLLIVIIIHKSLHLLFG